MSPLQLHEYYKKSKTDLAADMVLQKIMDLGTPITMCRLVGECTIDGIASNATLFKKVRLLKDLRLVSEFKHPTDKDSRKTYVRITAGGRVHLSKWGRS
jgi:hypothetical protein